MRRRQPPRPEVERRPCCGGSADMRAMEISLATAVELPGLLAGVCEHVLDELDERQRYFDDMRPADRDPRWYPPSPMRVAIDAELARRRTSGERT